MHDITFDLLTWLYALTVAKLPYILRYFNLKLSLKLIWLLASDLQKIHKFQLQKGVWAAFNWVFLLISALGKPLFYANFPQKQPARGVPRKRCSENMQQIYRRTPTPKCDFNCNFIQITLRYGFSPANLLHIFRTPFPRNTFGWLLLFPLFIEIYGRACKDVFRTQSKIYNGVFFTKTANGFQLLRCWTDF